MAAGQTARCGVDEAAGLAMRLRLEEALPFVDPGTLDLDLVVERRDDRPAQAGSGLAALAIASECAAYGLVWRLIDGRRRIRDVVADARLEPAWVTKVIADLLYVGPAKGGGKGLARWPWRLC